MALTEDEFRALIEKVLRARGVSAIRAARSANLNRDAIRSVLRGSSPSFQRTAQICEALGLELHVGLPSDAISPDEAGTDPSEEPTPADAGPPPAPLTRFTSRMRLPVRDFETCSSMGHLSQAREAEPTPAPVDLPDPHGFYVRAPAHSMGPAGIWPGDYCLVSPCAGLGTNQRVWLRNGAGQETIKWLVRLPRNCYELVSWQEPDEDGHQMMVAEQWMREDVVDRGVILAVYRGRPSVERPPFRAAEWRPEQVLSRQLGLDEDRL